MPNNWTAKWRLRGRGFGARRAIGLGLGLAAGIGALTGCNQRSGREAEAALLTGGGMKTSGPGAGLGAGSGSENLSESGMEWVGGEAGVEMIRVATALDSGEIARVLGAYAGEPSGVEAGVVQAWGANGFRVVAVPTNVVNAIADGLSTGYVKEKQWLGQMHRWTTLASGSERRSGRTVSLNAERVELGAGRLELAARAWVAPVMPGDEEPGQEASGRVRAAIRLEMLAYLATARNRLDRGDPTLGLREASTDPLEGAFVFERLTLRAMMRNGRSLVIVPEEPSVDWRSEADRALARLEEEGSREGGSGAAGEGEVGGSRAPGAGEVTRARPDARVRGGGERRGVGVAAGPGPRVIDFPTIGEAILMPRGSGAIPAPAAGDGDRGARERSATRMILILIPRSPTEYRLTRD